MSAPRLQTVLSRSSAFLHRATQGLVQFRDVTIALPPHWPPAEHGDTLASVRANAPIRIVSNEEAQWPRTVQPRSCGQPGEYTLLPADALRNAQAGECSPTSRSPPPAKGRRHRVKEKLEV
ncbi:hypothetical protein HPB51_024826 [Rhipicephalus microplus]|uniref:Calcium-activated chloride channel N-terminal domain-containing protein n=1 Tax=Rhipicephalus microplus TaxID=6941 RepID=A0A9J6F9U5_RHIMP|nr:hypothetical protein HPB51_024826 [Rhipicephalus microplus]